jgi:hypothetical protein
MCDSTSIVMEMPDFLEATGPVKSGSSQSGSLGSFRMTTSAARNSSSDGEESATIRLGDVVRGKRVDRTRAFDRMQLANQAAVRNVLDHVPVSAGGATRAGGGGETSPLTPIGRYVPAGWLRMAMIRSRHFWTETMSVESTAMVMEFVD